MKKKKDAIFLWVYKPYVSKTICSEASIETPFFKINLENSMDSEKAKNMCYAEVLHPRKVKEKISLTFRIYPFP